MATHGLRHLLLFDSSLNGYEYGMQRALEAEILLQTEGTGFDLAQTSLSDPWDTRFGHGTRYETFRPWLPKKCLKLPPSDVLWLVLMAPENYRLDLFHGWEQAARYKIVYLFDTLPHQYRLLTRLFSNSVWDCCITSFNDAVPVLERMTGRRWHHVNQAVPLELFKQATLQEKIIHFSAYGRRHPAIHQAILQFCQKRGLYYDFTPHAFARPAVSPDLLYRQYAWHLSHSLFTVSWPVELTNPARAGDLRPITCRWFEAAAAGAAVLGQTPVNPHFRELFGDDFVTPIAPDTGIEATLNQLESIWRQRAELSARALALRQKLGTHLDWSARVKQMMEFIQQDAWHQRCS